MTRPQILMAYAGPVVMAVVAGAMSYFSGDPANTVFLKALLGPMFILASIGLRHYFPEENDATRGFAAQAEFQILNGALLSAFIVLVIPYQGQGVLRLVAVFLGATVFWAAAQLALFWLGRRKADRNG